MIGTADVSTMAPRCPVRSDWWKLNGGQRTENRERRTEDRGRRTEVKKMTKHPAFAEASAWQANDQCRRNDRVKLRHAASEARMERSYSCSLNLRRRRHIIVSPGAPVDQQPRTVSAPKCRDHARIRRL